MKTAVETTETSHAVAGDADTSKVVRAGTFGRVRKFWEVALVEAGKLDKKNIEYDIFLANSNSFWGTMLRVMGINPDKEDVRPRSNRIAPGPGTDLRELRPGRSQPLRPFDLEDRSELDFDRPDGRTRFAEDDELPLPTDLAQLAISAARRRRRRRRRHGQLS